jgi:hypothetical protein
MAVWSAVSFSELSEDLRLDAEFYRPKVLALRAAIQSSPSPVKTISEIAVSVINFGAYSLCNSITFQEFEEKGEDSVEFITAQDIQDGFIDFANARWIPERQHKQLLWKSQVTAGQVLVAMAARLGHAAVYDEERPLNSSQDIAKITVRDPAFVDPYYLATYVNSGVGRELLLAAQTGSVQQHTNLGRIKDLRVVIAPKEKQQKIARLYRGALAMRRSALAQFAEAENFVVEAVGLDKLDLSPKLFYERPFADLLAARRFNAEYFMPCKKRVLDALARMPGCPVSHHYRAGRDLFQPGEANPREMVRNFGLTEALDPVLDDTKEPTSVDQLGSAKKQLTAGDIVISRLRSYLKEIALVRTTDSLRTVGSSEFIVLRPKAKAISAATLLIYLRSLPVQTVLKWSQDGSNHPRFNEADLLALPVPEKVERAAPTIDGLVEQAISARREARLLLEQAKAEVERLIVGAPRR